MTIHKNNLDITLTNEVKATITSNMDALGESLDFLSAVLPNDGCRLYRMGDKSESFVRQAHQVVRDHGNVLPLGLSLEQMDRDMDLRETLLPLQQRLSQMLRLVTDTYALAGSDLMHASMIVYRSLKSHGAAVGLNDVTASLGRRFAGQGRQTPTEPEEQGGAAPAPVAGE